MEYIQIPVPDFSFEDVVKRKARKTAGRFISQSSMRSFGRSTVIFFGTFKTAISEEFNSLNTNGDKIVYICEYLNYLTEIYNKYLITKTVIIGYAAAIESPHEPDDEIRLRLNELKYFLYSLITSAGYNLDLNAFDEDEATNLVRKINAILIKLDEIQVANEILFNEVNDLKSNFESLKSDVPLGKTRWYQRATGIVTTFAATKGADAVFDETLKPMIADLIHHTPVIEQILSLTK